MERCFLDNKIILQLIIKKLQAGATVKISVCYWSPGRKSVLQEKAEYLMKPGTPLIISKITFLGIADGLVWHNSANPRGEIFPQGKQ